MRLAVCLVALFAVACGGSDSDTPSCGASNPVPPCVAGGLSSIDVAGTWTFQGTQTSITMNCFDSSSQTTRTAEQTFPVSLIVTDCSVEGSFQGLSLKGTLDDTAVRTNAMGGFQGRTQGSVQVCVDASGALQFSANLSWVRCGGAGDQGSQTISGTLTR